MRDDWVQQARKACNEVHSVFLGLLSEVLREESMYAYGPPEARAKAEQKRWELLTEKKESGSRVPRPEFNQLREAWKRLRKNLDRLVNSGEDLDRNLFAFVPFDLGGAGTVEVGLETSPAWQIDQAIGAIPLTNDGRRRIIEGVQEHNRKCQQELDRIQGSLHHQENLEDHVELKGIRYKGHWHRYRSPLTVAEMALVAACLQRLTDETGERGLGYTHIKTDPQMVRGSALDNESLERKFRRVNEKLPKAFRLDYSARYEEVKLVYEPS
jgi:hypothetical protein